MDEIEQRFIDRDEKRYLEEQMEEDTEDMRPILYCASRVYVRDTYRRTGRTKSGFEMHYTERQCKRKAEKGKEYCWQHRGEEERRREMRGWR